MQAFIFIFSLIYSIHLCAQTDFQKKFQNDFILVEPGDTIFFPEGKFKLDGSLWLDGKTNVVIQGAGMDKTILSFKGQKSGAEGIKVTSSKKITLRDLTVEDSKGDCIKTQNVDMIQFINVCTRWTGQPKKTNGAYGLYPVQCSNILIEGCVARGASDAGIYVGQSKHIIVRNCKAIENVAGIEIENSLYADVYDNIATKNTGGVLVFDLPNLPMKKGGMTRVFNNKIFENNHRNFAPKGNIVGKVPKGTGVILLAANHVEVFNNQIENNRTMSLGVISYYMTENPLKDSIYYPYPEEIHVHHNQFNRKSIPATLQGRMGKMFWFKLRFGSKVPHILYDGITDVKRKNTNPVLCIHDNKNESFADIDASNGFKSIKKELSSFQCQKTPLKPNVIKN